MNHKNEQGYSLIGVLLIITIVAIVDVSLAGITLQSVKTSTKERDNQAVYYIAEAGMEYVIHQLESKVQIISEDNPNLNERDLIKEIFKDDYANGRYEFQDNKHTITYQDFEPIEGKGIPEARITFAVNENPAETPVENTTPYEITSVGEVGSEKRAVGTTFGIEKLEASEPGEETGDGGTGQSAPSYAIFVEDDLLLHGALTISYGGKIGVENINGDIAITNPNNLTVDKPAKFNENEHLKMPSLPKYEFDSTYNCIEHSSITNDCDLSLSATSHPIKLTDNTKIRNLNIDSNVKVTFEIEDNVNLNIDNLLMGPNSEIDLKTNDNKNHLNLNVNNNFELSGNNKFNSSESQSQFYLYYQGENKMTMDNIQINGSIYLKQADLLLKSGSNIKGNIFSGGEEIYFYDGTYYFHPARLILAPNAKIKIRGTLTYFGQIIVKSIEADKVGTGDATINLSYQICDPSIQISPEEFNIEHDRFCPSPRITGPISIKKVDEHNSGESSNNSGGNGNGNNNGTEGKESSNVNNIGKIKEVPLD